MCIVTREVKPKGELVRFVLAPDHSVVPDLKGNLPGRGVWVSADSHCIATAIRKNAFARGFKATARAGADLVDLVGTLLARQALGLLSLARKAGMVRIGAVKVQKLAQEHRVAVLIHAADAAEDGMRKISGKIMASAAPGETPEMVRSFTSEELSLALGRSNVIHAALCEARLTREFVLTARKYESYWQGEPCAQAAS